jgi:hypothetical protein
VRSIPGNLVISGAPIGGTAGNGLFIQGTAAHTNNFTVMDGTHFLGTYKVGGGIILNLTGHQGERINIDLNGNTIGGNLLINLGNGDRSANVKNGLGVYNSAGATAGQIGGSLIVRGGSGAETFLPGFMVTNSNAPTPLGLKVGGDLTFNAKPGFTTAGVGDVMDTGVSLATPPTVIVGGNVNTTAVDSVGLSNSTTVGKSVTIQAAGERPLSVQVFAIINQNLTITGSFGAGLSPAMLPGATGDVLEVGGFAGATAVVGGTTQITGGPGSDFILIDVGTLLGGNTTVSTGAGNDSVTLDGTFLGNLSVNLGSGDDSLAFDAGASVAGSMNVTLGNGNNKVGSFGGGATGGTVGGGWSFNLGNGNDSVTLGNAPGGLLFWTSGNGNSALTLAPTAASNWNVNLTFGSGNDSLTLAGTASLITGRADGGAGTNVFTQDGWTIVPPWTLANF